MGIGNERWWGCAQPDCPSDGLVPGSVARRGWGEGGCVPKLDSESSSGPWNRWKQREGQWREERRVYGRRQYKCTLETQQQWIELNRLKSPQLHGDNHDWDDGPTFNVFGPNAAISLK